MCKYSRVEVQVRMLDPESVPVSLVSLYPAFSERHVTGTEVRSGVRTRGHDLTHFKNIGNTDRSVSTIGVTLISSITITLNNYLHISDVFDTLIRVSFLTERVWCIFDGFFKLQIAF